MALSLSRSFPSLTTPPSHKINFLKMTVVFIVSASPVIVGN